MKPILFGTVFGAIMIYILICTFTDKDFNNYKKNNEKMITIEVSKEDLVNLITGTSPSFDLINSFTEMGIGNYIGGHVDRWNWNRSTLENLDEHELLEIYNRMRK